MPSPAAALAAAQGFIAANPGLAHGGDIDLDFSNPASPHPIQLLTRYTQAVQANPPLLTSLTSVRFGDTVVTCPMNAIRWTGVTVVSIDWLNSHGTLTNQQADWTFAGATYPKPEWSLLAGRADPVSATSGGQLTLDVGLTVAPAFASAENCHIVGIYAGVVLFEWIGQLHGGHQVVRINEVVPEPIVVREQNVQVQWLVRCADSQNFDAGMTANRVFLTLGAPIVGAAPEQGPTLRRMEAAMVASAQAAAVSNDISFNIIMGLWPHFPDYVLVADPGVPANFNHPTYFNAAGGAWPIGAHVGSGAECQAIVRFVKGILDQIGSPAQTTGVVVWADPNNPNVALEAPLAAGGLGGRTMMVLGVTWYAGLADGPIVAGQPVPQGTRLNNFEACLRYANAGVVAYFPGGVQAIRNSADEVLRGFTALVWTATRFDQWGNPVLFCEHVIRYYP